MISNESFLKLIIAPNCGQKAASVPEPSAPELTGYGCSGMPSRGRRISQVAHEAFRLAAATPRIVARASTCNTIFGRTNMPCLGGHSKYRFPHTLPLLLPTAISSLMPRHVPENPHTSPTYATTPTSASPAHSKTTRDPMAGPSAVFLSVRGGNDAGLSACGGGDIGRCSRKSLGATAGASDGMRHFTMQGRTNSPCDGGHWK
mmetsp:Transcript_48054/g.134171  ORF Transcript_48054/g.134171 Transcript_48054/m.134171 type:complete len:203 (-) Transcript_48054:759-1367(-)